VTFRRASAAFLLLDVPALHTSAESPRGATRCHVPRGNVFRFRGVTLLVVIPGGQRRLTPIPPESKPSFPASDGARAGHAPLLYRAVFGWGVVEAVLWSATATDNRRIWPLIYNYRAAEVGSESFDIERALLYPSGRARTTMSFMNEAQEQRRTFETEAKPGAGYLIAGGPRLRGALRHEAALARYQLGMTRACTTGTPASSAGRSATSSPARTTGCYASACS
jgi:hypothetical protein